MKIVHVTTSYPPMIGGMENAVKELAERTAKKGHDVTIITSSCTDGRKLSVDNKLKLERIWSIKIERVPIIMPTLPFKLLKCIDSKTIVHIHYVLSPFMDFAIWTSRLKGAKVISHIHVDPQPAGVFRLFNPAYKKYIWTRSLPLSQAVICPTPDYVGVAEHYRVPANKCNVIPSGVDLTLFKRKSSYEISKPVKILYVGRLNQHKNITRLLDAFRLFQSGHDAVLNIVGEGEERATIAAHIASNQMSNVIMTGALEGQDLADIYTASDIFVLPSSFESFGIVNLEAMASGLPIIASDIPGLRNLLEGIAILVEPTVENLTAAMSRLVEDNGLRNEMIGKSLERVKDYNWDIITDKVIDLYRRVDSK